MKTHDIEVEGDNVYVTRLENGAAMDFTIRSSDCEVGGYREYLVDNHEHYRVRLFNRTSEALLDAVMRYESGTLGMSLFKHPM